MKLKRITLALALILVSCLTVAGMPRTTYATESTEELQAELDAAYAELDELQRTLDQANAELGKTNYDLEQTEQRIAELEEQIAENEQKLAESQENLAEQATSSYKQNTTSSLLDIITYSTSFDDLVSRVFYANSIAEAQQDKIQEVIELQEELENDKAELEEKLEEQKKLQAEQEEEVAAADAAAAAQADYVNQLSDEVKAAIEEERKREAEESRRRAEEARKAQEAAEQEQNQNQNDDSQDNGSGGDSDDGGSEDIPTGGQSSATGSQREIAVNAALAQVGKNYGHANNGYEWDCNGLTHYAWAQAGVDIPYTSGHYSYGQFQWMKNSGRWVTTVSQLKPGDLIFYSYDGGRTTYHVAMYIGDGMMVNAESYAAGVQVRPVNWCYGFCGGGSPI